MRHLVELVFYTFGFYLFIIAAYESDTRLSFAWWLLMAIFMSAAAAMTVIEIVGSR